MRKIIQIAVTPDAEHDFDTCFALCDDGTVWMMRRPTYTSAEFKREWLQLPPLTAEAEKRRSETRMNPGEVSNEPQQRDPPSQF